MPNQIYKKNWTKIDLYEGKINTKQSMENSRITQFVSTHILIHLNEMRT